MVNKHSEAASAIIHTLEVQNDRFRESIIKIKQDNDNLLQKNMEIRQLARKMLEENERLEKRLDDV